MIVLIIAVLVFVVTFLAMLIKGSDENSELEDELQVMALTEYLEKSTTPTLRGRSL